MFFDGHLCQVTSFWGSWWINHCCMLMDVAAWTVAAWAPMCKAFLLEGIIMNFENFLTSKYKL